MGPDPHALHDPATGYNDTAKDFIEKIPWMMTGAQLVRNSPAVNYSSEHDIRQSRHPAQNIDFRHLGEELMQRTEPHEVALSLSTPGKSKG